VSSCAETGIDVVSLVSVSITVPSDVNVAKPDIAFGALPASGIRVNSQEPTNPLASVPLCARPDGIASKINPQSTHVDSILFDILLHPSRNI
jgi:hypothetical protein